MKTLIARFILLAVVLMAGVAYGETNYDVTHLPPLGGTNSAGNSINNAGWVAGFSNFADDQSCHAALWRDTVLTDLGSLGGPNSNVPWPVKNNNGIIAGIAETSDMNPLNEDWSCSAFFPNATKHNCVGFVWNSGVMTPLPTLGGYNGFAAGVNQAGQVVGWAENTIHDPTCTSPQVLQFQAVIWSADGDLLQELSPLPGDFVGAATAINDDGQVVGISGKCDVAVGRFSAAHAVMWENGEVHNLGTLGGIAWNTPMAINKRGDVVGFSNVSEADGGRFNAHAFLWRKGVDIKDLGTLNGHKYSQGLGINKTGQVVGMSCTAGFASCSAFLYQHGQMVDLNDLVPDDYAGHLIFANDINDAGEISGAAYDPDADAVVAFQALPLSEDAQMSVVEARGSRTETLLLPEDVRRTILRRVGLGRVELAR